ncbi:hypothetical protein EIG90_14890, partial [Staphylococcus aureus]
EKLGIQFLFVGAPPARLTRIEKSLLQANFRSVNYCHYNFVEHRTLIYVSGSLMQLCRASNCVPLNLIHILSIPQYVTYLKKTLQHKVSFEKLYVGVYINVLTLIQVRLHRPLPMHFSM